MSSGEDPAVTNFRNYLRIKTVQPEPDYDTCTEYLRAQAEDLGADCRVVEYKPGTPTVIMTLAGEDPSLPSLLLNSHTDVVPVFPEHWKYDPFSAHKDEEGNIYARGTQDMKSVGIQYLEALKRLRRDGQKFLRTIHLTFVPDEEIDGTYGMGKLVKTELFQKMNVGLSLDEGYASTTDTMLVFNGQRSAKSIMVTCSGDTGHGSQFITNTAGEKVLKVTNSFLSYRDEQERKLRDNPNLQLGDVVTINMTLLQGGKQINVVPAEFSIGFDVRVPPWEELQVEEMVQRWCEEAGQGVTWEMVDGCSVGKSSRKLTCIEDGKNPWWDAFSAACQKENVKLQKGLFPAGTDSSFISELGIDALGFSPINNTPRLLHGHNEFLNEKVFLRGVDIYASIISALANVKPF